MTDTRTRKWKACLSVTLALVLLLGMIPVNIIMNSSKIVNAEPLNGFHEISSEGSGTGAMKTSSIVTENMAPAGDNIKGDTPATGDKYKVGNYYYTGKYITYNSDFYDYYSNEEIEKINGGNITSASAISAGWSDPYTRLNKYLQGQRVDAGDYPAHIIDTNHIEIDFSWMNDTDFYNDNNYLYLYSLGQKPLGEWPGTKLKDISYMSNSERKILNIFVKEDTVFHVIRNYKKSNGQYDQSEPYLLYSGRRYFSENGWDIKNPGLAGVNSYNNVVEDVYSHPLYFGCFWLDNGETGSNYGDYNSHYTDNWKRDYANFQWVPNIAVRNDMNFGKNYRMSASVRGLVGNTTIGDGLDGKLRDVVNNDVELPYLNKDWLRQHNNLGDITENIQFPFYEVKLTEDRFGNEVRDALGEYPTYYQFNSRDRASLYLDKQSRKLYEHDNRILSQETVQTGSSKGFFPYNMTDTDAKANNLAFGVKYEIPFVLNEDGTVKGMDAIFEFMGDDDVWVFVDGQLLLDMGGNHKDAYGKINFNINKSESFLEYSIPASTATMSAAASAIDAVFDTNYTQTFTLGADSYKTVNGVTKYDTTKVHTLTMYFMERGMWESDNFIRFNFAKQNNLTVENRLVVEGVNPGFENAVYEAANYDVFTYDIENTNITENPGEYSSNGLKNRNIEGAIRKVNDIDNTETIMNSSTTNTADDSGLFDYTQPGPVKNTLFERYDENQINRSDDIPFIVGKTNENGSFGLLYGQDSSFKYQFFSNSDMKVVQKNNLGKLTDLDDEDKSFEEKLSTPNDERLVSDYYTTTWSLKDIESEILGEDNTFKTYNNGTYVTDGRVGGMTTAGADDERFRFQNKTAMANIGVDITARFVNKPKVGSVKVRKYIDGNIGNSDQNFTLKIEFSNIFGQNGVSLGDYTAVTYKVGNTEKHLSADGTFTLKTNEEAVFEGIPVQTKVKVTEVSIPEGYELDSILPDEYYVVEAPQDPTISVFNKRITYDLTLQKELEYAQGAVASADDEGTEYIFDVQLGFDNISEYRGRFTYSPFGTDVDWQVSDRDHITASIRVSKNKSVKINNIPVGTQYTITENTDNIGDDFDYKSGNTTASITDNTTVTITNTKRAPDKTSIIITKRDSVTNTPIPGAVFELYATRNDAENRNNPVAIAARSNDGTVFSFDGLELNTKYFILEATVPDNYTADQLITEVTTNNSTSAKHVDINNDPIRTSIVLTKIDSETQRELPGAEFEIYASISDARSRSHRIAVAEKNNAGTVFTFSNLNIDTNYYIRESTIPEGYTADQVITEVRTNGNNTAKQVDVTNTPIKTSIVVTKLDSETQQAITGADFVLYATRDDAENRRNPVARPTVSNDRKSFTFSGLSINTTYYLVETTVPEGYTADQVITEVTTNGDNTAKQVDVTNNPIKTSIIITKKNSATQQALPGAEFELYPTRADAQNKTNKLATAQKNNAGTVFTFRNLTINTTYYVLESKVPAGYTADSLITEVTTNSTEAAVELDVTNTPIKTGIIITKRSSTGNRPAIPGAEFELYATMGDAQNRRNKIATAAKSQNGTVFTFSDLDINTTYYVYESKVPSGYTSESRITAVTTGSSANAVEITVYNRPVDIVMPETGGLPAPVSLTFVGILAMSLAGAAMLIYKKKLQKAAVNTNGKGRHEDQ